MNQFFIKRKSRKPAGVFQANYAAALLAALLLAAPALMAQEKLESPGDMDRATSSLSAQIVQRINTMEGNPRISLGAFQWDGFPTPLGNLWALNLSQDLANASGSKFTISADSQAAGTAQIQGEIVEAGNSVRIYTRLVRLADQTILGAWHRDLEKTPFIMDLLAAPGSGRILRDSFEPDNRESPTVLEIRDVWIGRSIHAAEDQDWFIITPRENSLILAETSGELDTYMELYDPSRSERIRSDDDGGEGLNSRLVFSAEAGKNTLLMIKGLGRDDTGFYRVKIAPMPIPDAALEPNNTPEEAKPWALDQETQEGFLNSLEDVDFYEVEIPASGGQLRANIRGGAGITLGVYDSQANLLGEQRIQDGSANVTVQVPGGRVYLKAEVKSGSALSRLDGFYTLSQRFRVTAPPDSFENDNQRSMAKPLGIGETQRRSFSTGEDVDWVVIRVTEPGRYAINAGGETSNRLDTALELYDSDNNEIAEDDDGGDGYSSYLSRRLEAGTYYLKVRCLDSEPEDHYNLSIQRE